MMLSRLSDKERFFREFSIWPHLEDFDNEGWLKNFTEDEKPVAERLLAGFSFFNERMTDALLWGAIQRYIGGAGMEGVFSRGPHSTDLREVLFVTCEGEQPHPTDSGNLFSRRLRDKLGVPEWAIASPADAVLRSEEVRHYIFFDDFVGSGNQFRDTLNRQHRAKIGTASMADLASSDMHTVSYCVCVCTQYAYDRLFHMFPNVRVTAAHLARSENSALNADSHFWKNSNGSESIEKIKAASARAGYASEDYGLNDWRGFYGLGLSVAFSHGIPDASLPIFFSTRNSWTPLMRRAQ